MMLMPDAPAPGRMKPVKGLAVDGAKGGNWPVCRIEEEHVAGPHLDRERAAVESPLERLDLERHTVVVDAVAPVHARAPRPGRPVEAEARSQVVEIAPALALEERRHDRVDLVHAADVLDVRVDLVPQAGIDRQVRPHPPVVLHEPGQIVVVRIRNHQCLVRFAAAQRHREQQIAIVGAAVAVVIESGEVFDELDAPLPEHVEVEARVHPLPLTSGTKRVGTGHQRHGIRQLESLLLGTLGHAERGSILQAGERELRAH